MERIIGACSIEEEVRKCKSVKAMYLLLKTRLRAHLFCAQDDPRLYKVLTDAAHFTEVYCVCQGAGEQDQLRESGVLECLLETFLVFFNWHLKTPSNALVSDDLIKCWSHVCSALWHCVDNPRNGANQEAVIKGLASTQGLMQVVEFISTWTPSTQGYVEMYMIPIIQLLKGSVAENMEVQAVINSQPGLLSLLIQSFEVRIQTVRIVSALTWKSVDMLSWVLNLTLQYKNQEGEKTRNRNDKCCEQESRLCDLVRPCCEFMAWCEESNNGQSIGIILLVTCIFTRSLESVRRFHDFNGTDILMNINGSNQPEPVKEAMKALMDTLKCQNKALPPISNNAICKRKEESVTNTNTVRFSKELEAFLKEFKFDPTQMIPVPMSFLSPVQGADSFTLLVTTDDIGRNGRLRRALKDTPRHHNMHLMPVIPRVKGGIVKKQETHSPGILRRVVDWIFK